MRSHCALYVDAGYLLAAMATRVKGTSLRGGIEVAHQKLIDVLADHAETATGLPLLRVHWYDSAAKGVPDPTQEQIGLLPRVKVRLGRIGFDGEQKGVDLRIGLDLVAHARKTAVDAMYLVSGDDDLTEAVEEAQSQGVQVVILAVPNKNGEPHGVSRHLQRAADGLELLSARDLDAAASARGSVPKPAAPPSRPPVPSPALFSKSVTPPAPAAPAPAAATTNASTEAARSEAVLVHSSSSGTVTTVTSASSTTSDADKDPEVVNETIDRVVTRVLETWLEGRPVEQRQVLAESRPSIPQDIDRALLLDLSDSLSVYDLSDRIRYQLRARFWTKVDETEQR